MGGEEVELADILVDEVRKIAFEKTDVLEPPLACKFLRGPDMGGVDVDAEKAPSWMRGGEGRERVAVGAAELAVVELVTGRRGHAIDGGGKAERGRAQLRDEMP